MGALKGSIAVRRYAVVDPLPAADLRQKFIRGLRAHAFMPLDPKGESDQSVGWVSILDQSDADLRSDKVFFVASGGEQLRVSLRIDVLKPPSAEVRRQVEARAAVIAAESGRPLTRREKQNLKEEITRSLRQRAFPRVRVVDLVWDLDGRRIYFWSQTRSMNECFLDLFVKSFGLRVEVEGAGRWARAHNPEETLARLEPTRELWVGFSGLRPLSNETAEEDR
jgi:DNA recombination-dependent growth factor C